MRVAAVYDAAMNRWDAIVVGAGPAGLMAAQRAAARGRKTLLIEKNRRPGIKIRLSGGTRCNLTHATDARGIVAAFGPAGRFLHSALAALGPQQVVDLFEAEGVPTKVEEGGKVFPRSDRATDVLDALLRRLARTPCTLACDAAVAEIKRIEGGFQLVMREGDYPGSRGHHAQHGRENGAVPLACPSETPARETVFTQSLILATGGRSYPACGTTGDGYRWAAALGHTVVAPRTALVPIATHAAWVTALQGITIADVRVKVVGPVLNRPSSEATCDAGRVGNSPYGQSLAEACGSFLFTHFGVSGPVVLDVSRAVSGHAEPQSLVLVCDFLPEMTAEAIEAFLLRECAAAGKRQVAGILGQLIPQRLAEALMAAGSIPADCRAAEFARDDRRRLAQAVKAAAIPVAETLGFRKAEVTAGGVTLDEVDSRNMQSRLVPGLFFAGELLDLDGPIGGYNFQAAFSTGWLAGENV